MNKSKHSGITLIALIITIIVMLLLVAVTITMAINGNLFGYAGNAAKSTKEAVDYETDLASMPDGLDADGIINYYIEPKTKATFSNDSPFKTIVVANTNTERILELNPNIATILESLGETIDGSVATGLFLEQVKSIKQFTGRKEEAIEKGTIVSTQDSDCPIYLWFEYNENETGQSYLNIATLQLGTIYWWSEAEGIYLNENTSELCYEMMNLQDISGLRSIRTDNVTNMRHFFAFCANLTNINALSNWKTSNVTDMSGMFADCIDLTNISGVKRWDVRKVSTMENMFSNEGEAWHCSMTDLSALENWNTSSLVNMKNLFGDCWQLTDASAIKNWNTSNVTDMSRVFSGQFTSLDLRGWDTRKVTDTYSMFNSCNNLEEIIVGPNWTIDRTEASIPEGVTITVVNN